MATLCWPNTQSLMTTEPCAAASPMPWWSWLVPLLLLDSRAFLSWWVLGRSNISASVYTWRVFGLLYFILQRRSLKYRPVLVSLSNQVTPASLVPLSISSFLSELPGPSYFNILNTRWLCKACARSKKKNENGRRFPSAIYDQTVWG